MSKKIFVFNDGTDNALSDENLTNVAMLFNSLSGAVQSSSYNCDAYKLNNEKDCVALYYEGVGERELDERDGGKKTFWDKIVFWLKTALFKKVDILTGYSIRKIIERVLEDLNKVYEEGDEVYFIGFSRGAASIRIVAHLFKKKKSEFKLKYLLIFDTVYSVIGDLKIKVDGFEEQVFFENIELHPDIEFCDHLISGDEMRSGFPLTPVKLRENVNQILFLGAHSDVGGGLPSRNLSDISFQYALEKMKNFGISFDESRIKKLNLNPDPLGKIGWDLFGGTAQYHFPRPFEYIDFTIHESVKQRAQREMSVPVSLAQLVKFNFEENTELMTLKNIDLTIET